jgi:DNA-directed RNA polymerase subunit omega
MSQIIPPAEVLRGRVRSRFSLVVAAAKRARQLREGARPLVDCGSAHPVTIALHEIAQEKIIVTDADMPIPADEAEAEAADADSKEETAAEDSADEAEEPEAGDDEDSDADSDDKAEDDA